MYVGPARGLLGGRAMEVRGSWQTYKEAWRPAWETQQWGQHQRRPFCGTWTAVLGSSGKGIGEIVFMNSGGLDPSGEGQRDVTESDHAEKTSLSQKTRHRKGEMECQQRRLCSTCCFRIPHNSANSHCPQGKDGQSSMQTVGHSRQTRKHSLTGPNADRVQSGRSKMPLRIC